MESLQGSISLSMPTWEGSKTLAREVGRSCSHFMSTHVKPIAAKVWGAVSRFFAAVISFLGRGLNRIGSLLGKGISLIANTRVGSHVASHSKFYKASALIALALLTVEGARRHAKKQSKPQVSSQTSPRVSPQTSPRVSPQTSPRVSPQTSPRNGSGFGTGL